jgi:hypothetical protein
MFARREGLLLLTLCLAAVGCHKAPASREELAPLLPPSLTLETRSDDDDLTVEDKLRGLGAHVKDGKIVDSSGREVRFVSRFIPGAQPDPKEWQERQQREAEELDRLREKYTVVLVVMHGV